MTTAKQKAYERIRNAVFAGTFPPGFQLKEEELAHEFDVSRTPVREAIRSLADQGLVDIRSNRRAYVADLNEVQFEEVFDLLAFLESYSAGLASTNISKDAIAKLRELNAAMGETAAPEDNRKFLELNAEFHNLIHEFSQSNKTQELLQRIIQLPHNLYLKFGQIPDWHNAKSVIEHEQIIDALESGEQSYAEICMRAHTESVRRAFRELWQDDDKP
jgi:DNA-binding GntR family transcriptional regulator